MIDKTHVPPESRPRPQRAAAGSPEAKLLEWKRKPCRLEVKQPGRCAGTAGQQHAVSF